MDLVPSEIITDFVFNFSTDLDSPYSDILEELGFETRNIVKNLGSIFIYFVSFTAGLCILLLLKLSGLHKKRFKKAYKKLKQILLVNSFILLCMEGCMDFLISAFLNLQSEVVYTKSDKFSYYFSYFALGLELLVLPAGLIFVSLVRRKALEHRYWQRVFGAAYEGMRTDSKWAVNYNMF